MTYLRPPAIVISPCCLPCPPGFGVWPTKNTPRTSTRGRLTRPVPPVACLKRTWSKPIPRCLGPSPPPAATSCAESGVRSKGLPCWPRPVVRSVPLAPWWAVRWAWAWDSSWARRLGPRSSGPPEPPSASCSRRPAWSRRIVPARLRTPRASPSPNCRSGPSTRSTRPIRS